MQKRYIDLFVDFIVSMALAFPLSGLTISLVGLIRDPSVLLTNPKGELIAFMFGSVWFGILTPIFGGFPWADETGINRTNMYPFIIPTGLFIFFFFWRRWRKKYSISEVPTRSKEP